MDQQYKEERMQELMEQRWIEIRFYYLVKDLLKFSGDLYKTLDWIDALSMSNNYSPIIIKQLTVEMLQTPWMQPSKEEVIYLAWKHDVKMIDLKNKLDLHNKTIYTILDRVKDDSNRIYMPRFTADKIKELETFVNFFERLRRFSI